MKKLILFVVLLFSLTISAQEKKEQVVKTYTKALVEGYWYDSDLTVVYHYKGESNKIRMYYKNKMSDYVQQGITTRGETESGEKYQLLTLVDLETDAVIYLQYFENHYDYGIRLVFGEGLSIQFVEQ